MNNAVVEFGEFGIVPAVGGSDKVAGDALQFVDSVTAALGTCIEIVGSVFVAAIHTAVTVVIDAAISHIILVHKVYDVSYRLRIVCRIAVDFDIEDVSAASEIVIGRFDFSLMTRRAVVVYRDMIRVRIINFVCYAGNYAEGFAVFGGELAGQTFGGGRQYREVVLVFLAVFVGTATHVRDYAKTQFLGLFAFAVMVSGEGDKALGKSDETDTQGAMVDDGFDGVCRFELVSANPQT